MWIPPVCPGARWGAARAVCHPLVWMNQALRNADQYHSCIIMTLLTEGTAFEKRVDFRTGDTAATNKQVHFLSCLLFLTIYVSRTKAVDLDLILANRFPLVPPCGTSLLCLHSAIPRLFCHSSLSSHPLIFSLLQISLCWNDLCSP